MAGKLYFYAEPEEVFLGRGADRKPQLRARFAPGVLQAMAILQGRGVKCDVCGAEPGYECLSGGKRRGARGPHKARLRAQEGCDL